ncbi:MAG TPA: recombination-associated protein RdgC, partial [Deltaproteobacteria bacterium]|nr:recombination-associated protein RdgC [Deltaproteobacteria bacterium]
MGILSNTVSMYQYQVRGEPPDDAWVAERLEKYRFAPVDDIAEVETTGWVTLDDTNAADFGNVNVFSRPPYHVFTMRRDQRRVPQAALRVLVDRECAKWLAERPALTRVPARRRMEIREAVHASLTARTLPVPSTWDLVWNTDTSILTVCAVTEKVLDVVEDFFKKTFEGRTLEPVHPMARSRMVLGGDLRGLLDKHDEAPSKDVLLQIKRNRWLGWEFLLWLTYSTAQGRTAFEVQRDGPLSRGEGFIAYVHDRFVLAAEHESGRRTTSIKGLQTEFAEVTAHHSCARGRR